MDVAAMQSNNGRTRVHLIIITGRALLGLLFTRAVVAHNKNYPVLRRSLRQLSVENAAGRAARVKSRLLQIAFLKKLNPTRDKASLAAMLLQMQYSAISQPRATNWSSLRARVMPYSATRTAPAASGFIDWNRFLSNIPRDLIPDREMEVIRRKYPAGQASSRLAFTNV